MASGINGKHGAAKLISPPVTHKSPIWDHSEFRSTEGNGKKVPVSSVTTCKHCFDGAERKSFKLKTKCSQFS